MDQGAIDPTLIKDTARAANQLLEFISHWLGI
jgi:hypothetical protein